ncbi:MAG: hypothetical protein NUV72_11430, partial [Bauldia sp.]|nr:hypothetical protein [Bauldia sp.]
VVRLTQSVEGSGDRAPASDDETAAPIPLAPAQRPAAAGGAGEPGESTLAERLRALQHAGARH